MGRKRPPYEHVEVELDDPGNAGRYGLDFDAGEQCLRTVLRTQSYRYRNSDNESDLARATDQQPKKKSYYRGPRLAMYGVISVLLLNIVLLVVALVYAFAFLQHRASSFSTAVIYDGSCSTTDRSEMGLHFLINILSTGLLAASNYCMQYLNAPTRQDVDWAHAKGIQLRIGAQSFYNFLVMPKKSIIMWTVLLLTSLPIHLL